MNNYIQVTAAVILNDQQVLITQRAAHDLMGEKWEFPGGKIEAGETPQACLQRELQEELGIIAEVHDLFAVNRHQYPQFNIELSAYTATITSGQMTLHIHKDARWVAVHELASFDFCEADKPIVRKLITRHGDNNDTKNQPD